MTWNELCKIEPRLKSLLEKARRRAREISETEKGARWICANKIFYGELKKDLSRLVGWDREGENETLSSPEAYDLVYKKICNTIGL